MQENFLLYARLRLLLKMAAWWAIVENAIIFRNYDKYF